MLAEQGLAMPNLGDIDAQTISGALATGTHGTGARFPGLAACVTAVQLVLANASIVECSRHVRPELFAAARLGIGAIGIVTEVELACVPAFLVRAQERPERLGAVLERLPEWAADTDHVDLYVFPHTDRALVHGWPTGGGGSTTTCCRTPCWSGSAGSGRGRRRGCPRSTRSRAGRCRRARSWRPRTRSS